jgi:hypothetical protein
MATNSLGTTNANVIAQRALEILVADYSFLRNAVTDFSDEAAKYGASIYTARLSALTAADYSQANGYVNSAITQADVSIALNKFKHVSYAVDDLERTSSNVNLIERFAGAAAHALGLQMVGDLLTLVTSTSFTSALTQSSATFTYASVVSAGILLNNNNVPQHDRYAVLLPSYYGRLLNDTTIIANAQITGEQARTAGIGQVAGFNINMYSAVPSNSITLGGLFAQKEALVIAARVPEIPTGIPIPGDISVVTEPRTGLSLQVRESYNITLGLLQRTYALMYGVKAGETGSLVRIVGS